MGCRIFRAVSISSWKCHFLSGLHECHKGFEFFLVSGWPCSIFSRVNIHRKLLHIKFQDDRTTCAWVGVFASPWQRMCMFPHTLFLMPLIHSRVLLRRSSTPATQEELQWLREVGGIEFDAELGFCWDVIRQAGKTLSVITLRPRVKAQRVWCPSTLELRCAHDGTHLKPTGRDPTDQFLKNRTQWHILVSLRR